MRRLLSSALILSLMACASSPTPAVQTSPAATSAPEPAPVDSDAGAPAAAAAEVVDAGATPAPSALDADAAVATTEAPTRPATTPATTPATPPATTPPATTPAATGNPVAQGRAVFQRVCVRCHEDGDDDGPTPNKRWAEARMRTLIRSGNARMRAIPVARLSEADLTLLVGYLRSTHAIQ